MAPTPTGRGAAWAALAVSAPPNMTAALAALVLGRAAAVVALVVLTGLALRELRRDHTLEVAAAVMAAGLLLLALTLPAHSTVRKVVRPRMVQRVVPLAFIPPPRPQEMARMDQAVVPAAP